MLRKLESLEIKDGKIILKVRAKPGGAGTESDAKKSRTRRGRAFREAGQPKTEPPKNGRADRRKPKPEPAPPSRGPEVLDAARHEPAQAIDSRDSSHFSEHQLEELR